MSDPTDALDDGAELLRIMRKYWPETFAQAWSDAATELGIDIGDFTLENPLVQDAIPQLAKRIVGIAETTITQVQDLMATATQEGWSVDEIRARLQEMQEFESANRATMIARTETATAYEVGAHLAYAQSGVVSGTEWLLGPEPCPICQDLGGKVVPLGDEFAPGVKHAPAHPACRCATAPVLQERS